jgi:hypothetical protein
VLWHGYRWHGAVRAEIAAIIRDVIDREISGGTDVHLNEASPPETAQNILAHEAKP